MPAPRRPPILLHEVQEAGLTLHVHCPICKHKAEIVANALQLPGSLDMNGIGHRMRCTDCGRRGGMDVFPDSAGWVRYLRATGQRDRVPWYGAMMRENP
ncbi:hypothetical protein SAMN04487844_1116 [Methylobacterium sp. yr596]|nr:hypothetical protein SAMN04487844_1116 [Methylobacterium sp. yr596]